MKEVASTGSNIIYKATYSGVPVYEFACRNVAVMRRRKDSYLNATQILKVADFDKPQRTRILERSVQTGEHEKVQGGYGKYQGTWVPFQRGVDLATQYNVNELLRPLFDFNASEESPPLAPKHVTASATVKPKAVPKVKKQKIAAQQQHNKTQRTAQHSSIPIAKSLPSKLQQPKYSTPPPIPPPPPLPDSESDVEMSDRSTLYTPERSRSPSSAGLSELHEPHQAVYGGNPANNPYSDMLLEYFMSSDTSALVAFLKNPFPDFEVNGVIDDEGHTALHWVCAMGKVDLVSLLLDLGADINKENLHYQTPLMRATAFTNSYESRSFTRLVTLLDKSLFYQDSYGRTVLHSIAGATTKAFRSKQISAARYYLETVLGKASEMLPQIQFEEYLNAKDSQGDTALHICARNGKRKCVRTLMSFRADDQLKNLQGKEARQFIDFLELNRSRSASPGSLDYSITPQPTLSEAAARASNKLLPKLGDQAKILAASYDAELKEKEDELKHAKHLLDKINHEISVSQRVLEESAFATEAGEQAIKDLTLACDMLSEDLRRVVERTQAKELAGLVREEESKVSIGQYKENENDEAFNLAQLLTALQTERRELVSEIVMTWGISGGGERMEDYRKLIAMSCNVQSEDVDSYLDALTEMLIIENGHQPNGIEVQVAT